MTEKFYKDLVSTSGTYLFVSFIAIVGGILFPRLLGPGEWGLWSITLGLIWILGPFAQMAMSTTLVTFISKYRGDEKKVSNFVNSAYFIAILSSFVVSLCIITASGYLAESVFDDGRLRTFFLLGAIILFFDQLNIVNRDYFRGFKDFKKYNLLKILPELSVFFLSLALLVLISYRAIYLAITQAVVFSILCVSVFAYLFKNESYFEPFKKPERKETLRILRFGIPLIFTMTFITVMKSIDRILIGFFLELTDVGIYSVASGIPWMIGSMMAPVSIVLLPTLSERRARGASSTRLLQEVFSFLFFVSIPMIIFIILYSGDILWLLFGDEFLPGALVLSIASFEIFLFGGYVLFRTAVQATERTLEMALGIGAAAAVNTVLNIILIPMMGIEGAAVGTALSFLLLFIFMMHMVSRNYDIDMKNMDVKII